MPAFEEATISKSLTMFHLDVSGEIDTNSGRNCVVVLDCCSKLGKLTSLGWSFCRRIVDSTVHLLPSIETFASFGRILAQAAAA